MGTDFFSVEKRFYKRRALILDNAIRNLLQKGKWGQDKTRCKSGLTKWVRFTSLKDTEQ